jgi:signal peptidase I
MKRLINVVLIAGGVLGVVATVLSFFYRVYINRTGSMEPTIHIGERMIMRTTNTASRGDIIVFDYPLQPETKFAKRVVAIGGETVEIRDKQLFINGRKVDEPYAIHDDPMVFRARGAFEPPLPEPYRSRDQFGPFTVPPDSFFVLGDNRDRSSDSRYWGTVPHRNVRGVIIRVGFRKL